jgi:threonine dehydrogenase-like Zn-dependent dehydrogenase
MAWMGDSGLSAVELPRPEAVINETIVRVHACGICGTDLHLFHGSLKPEQGLVPGHEIAGVVEEGSSMPSGTLVAVEPVIACLICDSCRAGQPQRCAALSLMGISRPGGLQQFVRVPDANLYRLPLGVGPELGSLAEPLAVCIRALNLAELVVGSRVLILGAGTIGLMTLLLAREIAAEVAVSARYPHQQELARRFGATAVFEAGLPDLRSWTKAHKPDVVFETVGGDASTLSDAIYSVRPGGTVVALGVFTGRPTIPAFRLVNDEVRLIGSVMYGRSGQFSEFSAAVSSLKKYRDDLLCFHSARFPLNEANAAFTSAGDKANGSMKVMIDPST